MTRTTNLLLTEEAIPGKAPSQWPSYQLPEESRPDHDRKKANYPPSADEKGAKILPKGWQKDPRRKAATQDVLFDQNVDIAMRDGIKLKADVFRDPAAGNDGARVPTVLMSGPYGKTGTGPLQYETLAPFRLAISFADTSGMEAFEGLCPFEWIPRGYAIINVDSRGSWQSEGEHWMAPDRQAGLDGYDVVEWITKQSWSNGKVTMAGNSRLASIQYFVAAEQPPGLACIAPWEGIVDEYRSDLMRGGRPNFAFNNVILHSFFGCQTIKSLKKEDVLPEHEFDDTYWAHMRPDISRIEVPTYMLASYTSGLHPVGSVQIFLDAPAKEKWLRFHDSQEWYDITRQSSLNLLQSFYDTFCLDGAAREAAHARWSKTPPVTNCILPFNKKRGILVPSQQWPPCGAPSMELYLGPNGTMSTEHPQGSGHSSWQSEVRNAKVTFDWVAPKRMVLCGFPTAILNVSPKDVKESGHEMDIVFVLRKLDRQGNPEHHLSVSLEELQRTAPEIEKAPPTTDDEWDAQNGVPRVQTLVYYGATGMMRVSHRAIAKDANGKEIELGPGYPHHTHTAEDVAVAKERQVQRFDAGSPVSFKTGFWPMGMLLEAGEGLRLEVGGSWLWSPEFEGLIDYQNSENENKGEHRVHFGAGEMDGEGEGGNGLSRIVLPVTDLDVSVENGS
ncbi:unnamed protein product [Jaminaea pallidilutea]